MRVCYPAITCSIVFVSFNAGCGRNSVADLEIPEQLILYSIDGQDYGPENAPKVEETFHGYPVLGKVEIKEAEKREEIIAALKDGIAGSDGTMAKCFWPRHGIRAVEKGQTIDYVICFECYQLQVYLDGNAKSEPTIRKITAVHLDGNHDEQRTRGDFERWLALLEPGGVMIVDDVDNPGWPGVARALPWLERWAAADRGDRSTIAAGCGFSGRLAQRGDQPCRPAEGDATSDQMVNS